jgi:hypothetical protein
MDQSNSYLSLSSYQTYRTFQNFSMIFNTKKLPRGPYSTNNPWITTLIFKKLNNLILLRVITRLHKLHILKSSDLKKHEF